MFNYELSLENYEKSLYIYIKNYISYIYTLVSVWCKIYILMRDMLHISSNPSKHTMVYAVVHALLFPISAENLCIASDAALYCFFLHKPTCTHTQCEVLTWVSMFDCIVDFQFAQWYTADSTAQQSTGHMVFVPLVIPVPLYYNWE